MYENEYVRFDETKDGYYRLVAKRDFTIDDYNVEKGNIGGLVQHPEFINSDEYNRFWIGYNVKMFGKSNIAYSIIRYPSGSELLIGDTYIAYSNIYSSYTGKTFIINSEIAESDICTSLGYCDIYNSKIIDSTIIADRNKVSIDNSNIQESDINDKHMPANEQLRINNVSICNGYITANRQCMSIGPIGSRNGMTNFYFDKYGRIVVICGCFGDTIEEFEERVKETHRNHKQYLNEYIDAIAFAKSVLKCPEERKLKIIKDVGFIKIVEDINGKRFYMSNIHESRDRTNPYPKILKTFDPSLIEEENNEEE